MSLFYFKLGCHRIGSREGSYTPKPFAWRGSGSSLPIGLELEDPLVRKNNYTPEWLISPWLTHHLLLKDQRLVYGSDKLVWNISDIQWLPTLSR